MGGKLFNPDGGAVGDSIGSADSPIASLTYITQCEFYTLIVLDRPTHCNGVQYLPTIPIPIPIVLRARRSGFGRCWIVTVANLELCGITQMDVRRELTHLS